jgi:predicted patatin/cPLA2 family phospholipase
MSKTAMVCRGGGMRSAHGAGFLYALATQLHISYPDMVVGSSGNAANLLYFATEKEEQCDAMKRIWTELLSTPEFISRTRIKQIMNVDYLVDTVFRKEAPFDTKALEKSGVQYYISIVDARDGSARFVTGNDHVDPFELLRTTTALPVFYGKTVSLLGGVFLDGAVGQPLQSQIDFALRMGATKILFIDNSTPRTLVGKALLWLYALTTPKKFRRVVIKDILTKRTCSVPDSVDFLHVRREQLPASAICRNRNKLQSTFDQGVRDALELEQELKVLFRKTTDQAL